MGRRPHRFSERLQTEKNRTLENGKSGLHGHLSESLVTLWNSKKTKNRLNVKRDLFSESLVTLSEFFSNSKINSQSFYNQQKRLPCRLQCGGSEWTYPPLFMRDWAWSTPWGSNEQKPIQPWRPQASQSRPKGGAWKCSKRDIYWFCARSALSVYTATKIAFPGVHIAVRAHDFIVGHLRGPRYLIIHWSTNVQTNRRT